VRIGRDPPEINKNIKYEKCLTPWKEMISYGQVSGISGSFFHNYMVTGVS
jgi:hypothetical protein